MSRVALRLTVALAVLASLGCPRSPAPQPAEAPSQTAATAQAVRLSASAFAPGDRFVVTAKVTLGQAPVQVETRGRYEIEVEAVEGDQVQATIVLTEDETIVRDGARQATAKHRRKTIPFRGPASQLALVGASGRASLVATHFPARLLRDGVSHGATWSEARTLNVAGLPLELGLSSRAAIRADGRVEVTTTSRGDRNVELGVRLRIEGKAVAVFDPERRHLPRQIRGAFTTFAEGGPGDDARSTVTVDVQTRRIS